MLLFILFSFFQDSEAFKLALKQFEEKKYASAHQSFMQIKNQHERLPAKLMAMMSQYEMRNYANVKKLFESFLSEKDADSYLAQAQYILAKTYHQLNDYNSALEYWLSAIDNSEDIELTKACYKYIEKNIEHNSDTDFILNLQRNSKAERSQAILSLKSSEIEEKLDRFHNSQKILRDFIKKYPQSAFVKVAEERLKKIAEKIKNEIKIGILLPFNSISDVSTQIKEGIQFALNEFQEKNPDIRILIVQKDVGETVLEAIHAAKELAEDQSVVAIIGPLSSDQTAAVSLVAEKFAIPLLTPTASQNGLADLSSYLFQMYTDDYTLGKFIADDAIHRLKMKSFAVLSNASYGRSYEMARGFIETINELGGEIVSHQVYYPDHLTTLFDQFRSIRNDGIKKEFRDSLMAVNSDLNERYIDSLYRIRVNSNQRSMDLKGVKLDSSKIQVKSIDAIFFPISMNDHPKLNLIISNYFATNMLYMTPLGNQDWLDNEMLSDSRNAKILQNMHIYSLIYFDEKDINSKQFINKFRNQMKTTPELYHLIGYRSMSFLSSCILQQNLFRDAIFDNLKRKDSISTIGGDINFNHKARVNSGITILKLNFGVIEKIN